MKIRKPALKLTLTDGDGVIIDMWNSDEDQEVFDALQHGLGLSSPAERAISAEEARQELAEEDPPPGIGV